MSRIEEEKRTVEQMIRLYCRLKEGNKVLCEDCSAYWNMPISVWTIASLGRRRALDVSVPCIAISLICGRKCVR
jgi:hypothetical protein